MARAAGGPHIQKHPRTAATYLNSAYRIVRGAASPCHLTEARRYKLNLGRGPPFGAKVGGVRDDDYPVRRQLKPLQARTATERDAVSLLYRF